MSFNSSVFLCYSHFPTLFSDDCTDRLSRNRAWTSVTNNHVTEKHLRSLAPVVVVVALSFSLNQHLINLFISRQKRPGESPDEWLIILDTTPDVQQLWAGNRRPLKRQVDHKNFIFPALKKPVPQVWFSAAPPAGRRETEGWGSETFWFISWRSDCIKPTSAYNAPS